MRFVVMRLVHGVKLQHISTAYVTIFHFRFYRPSTWWRTRARLINETKTVPVLSRVSLTYFLEFALAIVYNYRILLEQFCCNHVFEVFKQKWNSLFFPRFFFLVVYITFRLVANQNVV